MGLTSALETVTRRVLPAPAARAAKRLASPVRYRAQLAKCREGYRTHGKDYPHRTLVVAGLPKSGTTWLERMLGSYPGFHEIMIPEVAAHEMRAGGSHDYELPDDYFDRFGEALVLSKMHIHGSPHNAALLRRAGVPYVVLFRDLRDVAVSNFFYVRNTPWHPEHPHYAGATLTQGLETFADRTLGAYADWVRSWDANRDPDASLVLRYEQMLADPRAALRDAARLFGLDDSDAIIDEIVARHSFKHMSGGREQGEADTQRFARKGVSGDWVNHFDDRLCALYDERIGDFLIEFGYEPSHEWAASAGTRHAG